MLHDADFTWLYAAVLVGTFLAVRVPCQFRHLKGPTVAGVRIHHWAVGFLLIPVSSVLIWLNIHVARVTMLIAIALVFDQFWWMLEFAARYGRYEFDGDGPESYAIYRSWPSLLTAVALVGGVAALVLLSGGGRS